MSLFWVTLACLTNIQKKNNFFFSENISVSIWFNLFSRVNEFSFMFSAPILQFSDKYLISFICHTKSCLSCDPITHQLVSILITFQLIFYQRLCRKKEIDVHWNVITPNLNTLSVTWNTGLSFNIIGKSM